MVAKIKTNWRKVRLRNFVNINPSVILQRGKKYPFLDMADVSPFSRTTSWPKTKIFNGSGARFENKDTLFARITPCLENGKITQALNLDSPGFGSTEFYVLRGKEKVSDSDFIHYLSRTYRIHKLAEQSMIGASGRQRVERVAFENIEVEIPLDVNYQKRIAEIISAFDEKIELNNKINATLEQMTQAIFKEWFVKFRFPGYEKVKMVDSELGKIPEGWKIGKIRDIIEIISGFPFSSKLYHTKKGLGVTTIKNVQDGNFVRDFNSFIEKENLPNKFNPDCYLKDGDMLFSLTGNVGRACFVYGGQYLLNQRVAKLKPKDVKDFAFCYFLFRQTTFQNYLINMAKGSAQPNLSPVETGKIQICIPPRELFDNFSKLANPIYQRLIKNTNENQKLAVLRDLLLPKLMSGEIKV